MKYIVACGDAGERLDALSARVFNISRSAAARLIECGDITVNDTIREKKHSVTEGEEICLVEREPEPSEILAEKIPLDIIFEDDDILVINKPEGMVVHPAPANTSGTLVNALLYHCGESLSGIGGVIRPGIVHRIDKDTSGLLVVCKNDASHRALAEDISRHEVIREYHALVRGGFSQDAGTVDCPIGRHPVDRKKMAAFPNGHTSCREAVTHYEVLERFGDISYLKLRLETGRTHQIRVHMSYTGHPLLGDEVYGGMKLRFEKLHASLLSGQALHAKRLTLTHPRTKERMTFECPLPSNFSRLLEILRGRDK